MRPPPLSYNMSHTPYLSYIIVLVFCLAELFACRPSSRDSGKKTEAHPTSATRSLTDSLKLKTGMEITLRQKVLDWHNRSGPWTLDPQALRTIVIDNPSNSEGLSFNWNLIAKFRTPSNPTTPEKFDGATPPPVEKSPPSLPPSTDTELLWEGKITLANMTDSRQMTFPLFWAPGELFLSNSSALWLSDHAFEDLKKNQKTNFSPGILRNTLLGPAQGLKMLENSLATLNQNLKQTPERGKNLTEIKSNKKPSMMKLKVNGVEQEVEVLEAKNSLASYKILNNAQNPLLLEVRLGPDYTLGEWIFSPLLMVKDLLEYRVEEIKTVN